MKTIAVIGGTGGTGKWAVKGALLKGYKVGVSMTIPRGIRLNGLNGATFSQSEPLTSQ